MNEHYIVAVDQGHLRIYRERSEPGQSTPGLQQVEAMDFPAGKRSYTAAESDMAGRFQSSKHQSRAPGAPAGIQGGRTGMSIDERLPLKNEVDKRRAEQLAAEIEAFFQQRPEATFDFAAGPELNGTVLEKLSPAVRNQVRRSVPKDLVNQPAGQLRAHFAQG